MAKQAIKVIESPLVALVPRTHAVTLMVSGLDAWHIVDALHALDGAYDSTDFARIIRDALMAS